MKTFIAFSFIIALTACAQSAYQQPRLNGPGTQYEKWQSYVGDEDCFSVGKHYIPNQYFKCLDSGIEMVFRFRVGSGWAVGAPEGQSCIPVLRYSIDTGKKIPFPETPEKYKKQERKFYDNLKKLRELYI